MSTSLRGLARAAGGDDTSAQPWDPSTDPLGVNLMARARQQRFSDAVNGRLPIQGPLPDQRWDAYFLAMQDAAGDRPLNVVGSKGPDFGFDTNGAVGTETYGRYGMRMNRGSS